MYIRLSLRVLLISVGFCTGLFVLSARGATTYQTTLAECKKRTGLGAGLCKTLIKQNLNVDSCKKRTGLSAESCAQRIEEIKNDPEFSGVAAPAVPRFDPSEARAPVLTTPAIAQPDDGIEKLRVQKERAFMELRAKTKNIILALKNQGAEVSDLEAHFKEFEKQSDELLSAYGMLRDVYRGTAQESPGNRQEMRSEARGKVESMRNAVVAYYTSEVLALLQAARAQML